VRLRKRTLVAKFFNDRGTHLAAMIAYFALLSFVPLLFLTLSLLGFAGRANESSYLVTELSHAFPESSVTTLIKIVQTLQDNAAAFGIVGGIVLVWTSLSLFSVLESALNIVYGRPNRGFLRGKSLALSFMLGAIAVLFFGLIVASVGDSMLKRYVPGVTDNGIAAYTLSVLISAVAVFFFLSSIYRLLPNVTDMTSREVLPGALAATFLLEVTFQVLPLYIRFSSLNPTLRAFSGGVLLLVWLYVMANVIVIGAEVNWWAARRDVGTEAPSA
jgi:membrane protein